ncbi:MAG: Gx transporter family protein [Firmicutes bacterium]|nr:Gx transporter family protein [Bacillota bacterium]
MSSQDRNKRIAMAALLAALALIFSYVEAMIPSPVAIPGVKLGVANLVILIALYQLDFKYAIAINLVRIVVSGLLFSGVFGILYSLAGGMLSLIVMWLLKKTGLFSIIGVSMAGGVAHNIGQILVASAVVSDLKMFAYLPVLMFSGIISGILIGFLCHYVMLALKMDK